MEFWKGTNHFWIITLLLLISFLNHSSAQSVPPSKSIFDLLNYKEVLDVTLSFDLDSLLSNRRKSIKAKGTFSFEDVNGKRQNWKTKVTVRGNFRRIYCEEMPPLRLDFRKKDLQGAGLAKFDDFKLVTLCMDDKRKDRNYLFKEYLCYKMYSELTSASFRVQLVRILYQNRSGEKDKEQYAFLIEDFAQLKARMNAKTVTQRYINGAKAYHEKERKIVALFQYMIGNVDYDIHGSKNIKHVKKSKKIIPIPYDFDYAAIVSPAYAQLVTTYDQKDFEDRVYLGFETNQKELTSTIDYFKIKKKAILNTIESFELLPKREKRKMQKYCNSFFENLETIRFWNR